MSTPRCSGCGSPSIASSAGARPQPAHAAARLAPRAGTPGWALPGVAREESSMSGERRNRVNLGLAPVALVLFLVAPVASGAQQDSARPSPPTDSARLVGGVRSARNGLPLQGVTIFVRGTHRSDVTDSAGAFAVPDVPSGNQAVRILYGDTLSYEKTFHFRRGKPLELPGL